MKKLPLLVLLTVPFSGHSYELKLSKKMKGSEAILRPFLNETLRLLPKKVIDVLEDKTITINFKNLNKKSDFNQIPNPCERNNFRYGNYNLGKVSLDRRFLNVIAKENKDDIQFDCKHRNYYQLAQATLIHELGHAYDNKFLWSKRASNDKELKALGFWKQSAKNKNDNEFYQRSPDGYEYTKRKEFFAVNFEYFILDPQYKCRRPGLYNYLSRELNSHPHKDYQCEVNRQINFTDNSKVRSILLTPNKVKEVQYLFAAKGPAMFSKWGHSMFKLVICENETDTLEQCRRNSKDHVVVSFLAFINEMKLSAIKGVFGKYPARMLLSDVSTVNRQYTRSEFRSLKSLPLNFSDQERERFLNHLLRVYWEYSGRYYFFTNNCADEAFKLIQLAKNKRKIYKKSISTPIQLFDYLDDTGLIDTSLLNDSKSAAESGFFYPSYGTRLEKSYHKLKENFPNIDWPKSLSQYTKLSPLERRDFIRQASDDISILGEKRRMYTYLALEGHAKYLDANRAMNILNDISAIEELGEHYIQLLQETVELKNVFLYGASSKERGYGIPLADDLRLEDSLIRHESDKTRDKIFKTIRNAVKENNKEVFDRYENAKENIEMIKSVIFKN